VKKSAKWIDGVGHLDLQVLLYGQFATNQRLQFIAGGWRSSNSTSATQWGPQPFPEKLPK